MKLTGFYTRKTEKNGHAMTLFLCFKENNHLFGVYFFGDAKQYRFTVKEIVTFDLYDFLSQFSLIS